LRYVRDGTTANRAGAYSFDESLENERKSTTPRTSAGEFGRVKVGAAFVARENKGIN